MTTVWHLWEKQCVIKYDMSFTSIPSSLLLRIYFKFKNLDTVPGFVRWLLIYNLILFRNILSPTSVRCWFLHNLVLFSNLSSPIYRSVLVAETHSKRQATLHDCLPSLLGEEDKWLCTVRRKYFVRGRLEQPRQGNNLLYRHEEPNKPIKEGRTPFICTLWVPICLIFHSRQWPPLSGW